MVPGNILLHSRVCHAPHLIYAGFYRPARASEAAAMAPLYAGGPVCAGAGPVHLPEKELLFPPGTEQLFYFLSYPQMHEKERIR